MRGVAGRDEECARDAGRVDPVGELGEAADLVALPAVAEVVRALVYVALVIVAITIVLPAIIDLAAATAR